MFRLLKNASLDNGRIQPALLIEMSLQSNNTEVDGVTMNGTVAQTSPAWPTQLQAGSQSGMVHDFSFMGAPSDVTGMNQSVENASLGGGDLFEQLALLERTDSSGQFMQNLGFAPDLDLQEFFGDAYQSSDPMMAMMQQTPQYGP